MQFNDRRSTDRRQIDRRNSPLGGYKDSERRVLGQRSYTDRRTDRHWKFSWLRMSLSRQLSGI